MPLYGTVCFLFRRRLIFPLINDIIGSDVKRILPIKARNVITGGKIMITWYLMPFGFAVNAGTSVAALKIRIPIQGK